MNKSNVDWKSDVLYPITLFSVACLILLLSSFSTKASFETANTSFTESAISFNEEADIAPSNNMRPHSHMKGYESISQYPKTQINSTIESFTSDLFQMIHSPELTKAKSMDSYISIYTDLVDDDYNSDLSIQTKNIFSK